MKLLIGGETHDARQVGPGLRSFQAFEEPTRDPDVWPAPPPRDQWSQPPEYDILFINKLFSGFFFQRVRCVFQIFKFQITILKFKFPANNSKQQIQISSSG